MTDKKQTKDLDFYKLIPLVEVQHLRNDCIALLNEEWPRGITVRERTIEQSLNTAPPMAMVLLDTRNGLLVGHARVCPLSIGQNKSCWVESVIVSRQLRGLGIGRILMNQLEITIRKLNIKKICLSTEDKEDFYRKMGYENSPPVINFKAHVNIFEKCSIFSQQIEANKNLHLPLSSVNESLDNSKKNQAKLSSFMDTQKSDSALNTSSSLLSSPPLAPPLPPHLFLGKNTIKRSDILNKKIVYMCKTL